MPENLRFWSGTRMGSTFADRLTAARAGGFADISLFPYDYLTATREGLSDRDMRALLDDAGLRVGVVDPLTTWVPDWTPPPGVPPEHLEFGNFGVEEVFRLAELFGADTVSAIELWGTPIAVDAGTERFAALCDRAAERGLRVQLEFIPFSGIPDLATAWAIVRGADRANGGLVFDVWHWYRGHNDPDLLREVPGDRIFSVQVSDGPAQGEDDLLDECLHRRLLPGEGELDLLTLLRVLDGIGARPSMGVEVFSDVLAAAAPEQTGRRSGEALRALLAGV